MNMLSKLSTCATLVALSFGAQAQTLQSWMNPEVKNAWNQGYKGQKVTIHVIDDFSSSYGYYGNLGTGTLLQRHGEWTRQEANMIAPLATMKSIDFSNTRSVNLARGLNVLNLSYGMFAVDGYSNSQIGWSSRENSIITYAKNGSAIIAKAAGNDAVAVGAANGKGQVDYLNRALVGTATAIFVGALNANGTTSSPATMASYSNYAGGDPAVQRNFLVVGVEGSKTGLYGTSFAAPIISGYGAILGSKFTKANSTKITNQLLNTARTDTVANYKAEIHGRGEASIARALAPVSIR